MSNDLFNADIFSSNIPIFIKSDLNISKLLENLIAENYNQISGDIICVEQFQGNEINSNNYKVTTSSGKYLIKKFIDINEYNKLQRILSLSNWLNENDIKLGKVYLSNKDELIIKNKVDNSYWCVFDFINGSFFTGISDRELVSVGSEIGIFFNKLKYIPIELEPIEKIDYFKNSEDLMNEIERNKKNWVLYFGSDLSNTLTENWGFLQKTYSQLFKYKDTLLHSELAPCHIDLHPHNLLIEEDELKAILDVDSIKLNHTLVAISFSMYKLLRQSIVNRNIKDNSNEISRISNIYFNALIKEFPLAQKEIENLYIYAATEIFRRIFIIFSLNIYENNNKWNHILNMHLFGLKEAKIIFDSLNTNEK